MEDDGDADIYSGLGEYCSESTSDAPDSHVASAAKLDLLDASVLPKQLSPVKSENRLQGSATGTYFDHARSSSVSDGTEDNPSAVVAESASLVPSGSPSQPNPAQKDHITKTVAASRPAASLVAHNVKPDASAASAGAQRTMAALKRENEVLRHNISVLFRTAKHLMDSKDKEIVNLKRRLDNLVFKRNQRPQNSPHATASKGSQQQYNSSAAMSAQSTYDDTPQHSSCGPNQPLQNSPLDTKAARDTRHRYQVRSEPSRDLPRTPTAETSRNSPFQERTRRPQPTMPTKAKADMSVDLQRLYQYNSVRPRDRTEFSRVPALAVTPKKNESVSKRGVVTPTKSAAQMNARRLVKNSIRNVIGSPSKRPRRLEAYSRTGFSPLKKRRASERTAFAERPARAAQHNERRDALRSDMPLEHWEWEPRVKEPRTPPYTGSNIYEKLCNPHQGWPEESVDKHYDSPQLGHKNEPKGPRTSPPDETELEAGEIPDTPPKARKVVKGPRTPPEEYPGDSTLEKTPPLEGEVATQRRQTKAENERTESPAMKSDVAKISGPSKNVVPVRYPGGRLSSPFSETTVGLSKRLEQLQPRERLGIKCRKSPSGPGCSKRALESRTTVDKPLKHSSPGHGLAVENRRYRSPRDFGNLPAKRRRSRSRSLSTSPPPRPHSPRPHSQSHRMHDHLGHHIERYRIPSHHRRSPEHRSTHHRLRERYSPVLRRHYRTDRHSPSPPRLGKTSRRQPSPGRRPKSPLVRNKTTKEALLKQPAKKPLKKISAKPGSTVLVQENENACGGCQQPQVPRSLDENKVSCSLESETPRTDGGDVSKETKELGKVAAVSDCADGLEKHTIV